MDRGESIHIFSIPVDFERDADFILGDVIDERDALKAERDDLKAQLEVRKVLDDENIALHSELDSLRTEREGLRKALEAILADHDERIATYGIDKHHLHRNKVMEAARLALKGTC